MARIGVLPLARPTFDVAYATEIAAAAFAALDASGHRIIGARDLLFDAAATESAVEEMRRLAPDLVLLLQVTFTDASMTLRIADRLQMPLAIWAFPEPRTGGRLRLNAFCGLNLAAHALGLRGHGFGWLYAAPEAAGADLAELLDGGRRARPVDASPPPGPATGTPGAAIVNGLKGKRIGRIGSRPDGFQTCDYDPARLQALAGMTVEPIELTSYFDRARAVPAAEVAKVRAVAEGDLGDLSTVDQGQLDHSLRLACAFEDLRADKDFAAFAIRCWPETFTEYGGAACGPVAMMGERRTPCACEADVYGALTSLILQEAAGAPAFLVDLVDIDRADGTTVVWHCGQAPVSMHDPQVPPRAAIHSNRKMPLLYEFPLKPGRVTLARVSQARGRQMLVLAGAEMLRAPLPFSGTSGTLRSDAPAGVLLDTIIGAGLEHHMALVYGDLRPVLRQVAAAMGLPVLEIG
jgi:hypothetical protein